MYICTEIIKKLKKKLYTLRGTSQKRCLFRSTVRYIFNANMVKRKVIKKNGLSKGLKRLISTPTRTRHKKEGNIRTYFLQFEKVQTLELLTRSLHT